MPDYRDVDPGPRIKDPFIGQIPRLAKLVSDFDKEVPIASRQGNPKKDRHMPPKSKRR